MESVETSRERLRTVVKLIGHPSADLAEVEGIRIEGLMTMAPFIEDEAIIRRCFNSLQHLRDKWRSEMRDRQAFCHLSMGMSHDYLLAIEEGATILRIGSAIFSGA